MGTPDFASGILTALYERGHEVVLAVTQPDKPKGRGNVMQPPPVKEVALSHGTKVFQPKRVREPENVAVLREAQPDVIVVAAFGQILTSDILNLPKYGCINVHASLLPKYRGASPIQSAILAGETESGVTIMRMDEGIDTGDMIAQQAVPLSPEETGGSLFEKLSVLGATLLCDTLEEIGRGTATYTPQDHTKATQTVKLTKALGAIDWKQSAVTIERLVRGLSPWPGTYTTLNGKTLKIWKAALTDGVTSGEAGTVQIAKDRLFVATGDGVLEIKELQLEGKKRMEAGAFLHGVTLSSDTRLGA